MPVSPNPVLDTFLRPLKDLRISVTDRCNFRCIYCMPAEMFGPNHPFIPKSNILSFEEISRLVRIFAKIGVRKIKITGGEPLLRKDLPILIAQLNEIEGIEDIALVTNGSLLKPMLPALKAAKLRRITVSLDSLDESTFAYMNGVGFSVKTVLESIHAALDFGFPVKVNMVVKKGINDKDILPMARYFKELGVPLRFIEYMDVGNSNGWKMEHVVPSKAILETIDKKMPLEPVDPEHYGEVASRYRYKEGPGEVGFISSVTQPFCSTCCRARLSAEGKLYTCLFASAGHCLRTPLRDGTNDEELLELIQTIWSRREDRYSEQRSIQSSSPKHKVEMSHIGG